MRPRQLALKSVAYRRRILEVVRAAGAGHTAGDLSCIDILNVLYNRVLRVAPETFGDPDRDRYVQSKGHSAEALYVVLADRGFVSQADVGTVGRAGSHLVGHPTRKTPGVEHNTGALGHGLGVAVGMALAGKMDGRAYRVFTLLGDGELAEGSNWEAMLTAAHYELDNLTAIIDRNGMQITGRTEDVCALEPLDDKLRAFGWAVVEVDGHDVQALADVLGDVPLERSRPSAVIARTVKGRGVSFMEHDESWHHRVPDDEQFAAAMAELDALEAALRRRDQ